MAPIAEKKTPSVGWSNPVTLDDEEVAAPGPITRSRRSTTGWANPVTITDDEAEKPPPPKKQCRPRVVLGALPDRYYRVEDRPIVDPAEHTQEGIKKWAEKFGFNLGLKPPGYFSGKPTKCWRESEDEESSYEEDDEDVIVLSSDSEEDENEDAEDTVILSTDSELEEEQDVEVLDDSGSRQK